MSIERYIQNEVLLPRVQRSRALVVYDQDRRYRELCRAMANEDLEVVDATESSIESRDQALKALNGLVQHGGRSPGLLIYVPAKPPASDEDRQRDPFSVYAVCGDVFPHGDGDEYLSLCLKAKPDHTTEIRRIFAENANPDFAVIDKVGGGLGWPNLRALLNAESTRDILMALLAPSEQQTSALSNSDAWVSEARGLFKSALGLTLKTRSKTWSGISDELWRYLLFSEFVFDLPGPLPSVLAEVPHAQEQAELLVNELCDRLRNDQRTQALYIDRAETVERELNLATACDSIHELGARDTFPFEERSFFAHAAEALHHGDMESVRSILHDHSDSVWVGKGESQAQWGLLRAALHLIEACEDAERELPSHARSQGDLIDFYLQSLREADRLQREFEQAYGDHLELDAAEQLAPVVEQSRARYRRLSEKVQGLFTRHLVASGWPPSGRLANADVFDRLVAPRLQESGRRIAYLMVDALRYELGMALYQQLADDDPVDIEAAYVQLPSITVVGMASLLPGAGQSLALKKNEDKFAPMLGGYPVATVAQRMGVLRSKYGDRFAEMPLFDFVRGNKKIPETVNLLVLRSVDIDSQLENNPETALPLMQDNLKRIRVAITKLRKANFQDVVIVTDHGFFLNAQAEAGDVCQKPAGTWINVHERSLLGDGTEDDHSFVMPAEKAGIRGDFAQLAGPRSMAPYRAGMLYFHGGASLQESVVPVITVHLRQQEQPTVEQARVILSYKDGAKRITTRLPVVNVLLEAEDMFSLAQGTDFEILLEAHDKKGEVRGEAKPGGPVNPATGTVSLRSGERIQVTIKMQMDFEGKFTLKALNPNTLGTYATLDLETDYTV